MAIYKVKIKRDTQANLQAGNVVYESGILIAEFGTDGQTRLKLGDGGSSYNNLPYISGTGTGGGATNAFGTIAVTGQSNVVAETAPDTLSLSGAGITITTNPTTDTIVFTPAFGSVAGTVCQGNDTRLSDQRSPSAHAGTHKLSGPDSIRIDELAAPTDNTTLNATTTAHGLLPRLSGVSSQYLSGDGLFTVPAGGGGGTTEIGFGTIAVPGQTSVVIDAAPDTVTFSAKANVSITTNATTDTVTFSAMPSYINVKDYGAVGDGVTDDTTALQNAYNAACDVKGTMYIPRGVFITSGLRIGESADRYCTIMGSNFDTVGNVGGSVLKLKNGANTALITLPPNGVGGLNRIKELTLEGNRDNQTGFAPGIYVQAYSSGPPSGNYFWGIWLDRIRVNNTRNTGIHIGRYAGGSEFRNVWVSYCGIGQFDYGIHVDNYDVVMDYLNINSSGSHGLLISNSSQLRGNSINSYFNNGSGIQIDANSADIVITGGSVDFNRQNGIEIAQYNNHSTYAIRRTFTGMKFNANGQAANNTYSDLICDNAVDDVVLVGCSFMGNSGTANKVAYHILNYPGGNIRSIACAYSASGFASAVFSTPSAVSVI